MPNPQLTKEQREELFAPLFRKTKEELDPLSGEDPDLLFLPGERRGFDT